MTHTVFLQTNGTEWKKSASLTGKQRAVMCPAIEQKRVFQGQEQFRKRVVETLVLQTGGEPEDSCHGLGFF